MMERLKSLFVKKQEKPLVVCIHGFGRRRETEYNNFKLWGSETYDFITFNIFDVNDPKDINPDEWIRRCEIKVEDALATGRKVYLIGFSMGGVIASHLAAKYNIEKLTLFAPAFEYLSAMNVYQAIQKMIAPNNKTKFSMSDDQVKAFAAVVAKCKDSIGYVHCPVMFVHGDADEVIPMKSSFNAYDKVPHDNKRIFMIHEAPHRLMLFDKSRNEVYQLFELFMNDKIITYIPEIANDPVGELEKVEAQLEEIMQDKD